MKNIKLLLLMLLMTTASGVLNAQSFFDTTPLLDESAINEQIPGSLNESGVDYSPFYEVAKENGILNQGDYAGTACPFCANGMLDADGNCDSCARNVRTFALRADNPIGPGLTILVLLSLFYLGWIGRRRLAKENA